MDFGDLLILLFILAPLLQRFFGKKEPEAPQPVPQPAPNRPPRREPRRSEPLPADPERVTAREPRGGPKPVEVRPEAQAAEDPFAEALRQIREALGDAAPPEPEPLPEPAPLPEPPALPKTPRLPPPRPRGEFRPVGEFEHEAHGFGVENPLSEEVFERRGGGFRAPLSAPDPIVDLDDDFGAPPSPSAELAKRLADPERAREAFVLREVLDRPLALRRREAR